MTGSRLSSASEPRPWGYNRGSPPFRKQPAVESRGTRPQRNGAYACNFTIARRLHAGPSDTWTSRTPLEHSSRSEPVAEDRLETLFHARSSWIVAGQGSIERHDGPARPSLRAAILKGAMPRCASRHVGRNLAVRVQPVRTRLLGQQEGWEPFVIDELDSGAAYLATSFRNASISWKRSG
jgi:hypothetical protein